MRNPMMKSPIGLGLVFCFVLAVSAVLGTSAYAVPVSFTDDFNDGSDKLTFAYDQNFSGSFVTDFSSMVTLSSLGFNATNSHLFFGSSGVSSTSFDNLSVNVPIPEPTTVALFGIGLAGLAGAAVRRRLKKAKQ
ncbi:MAG: PEP-CTERM motif protein [Candidatus Scalindua rubra]|uniref:PEP-CTERM motif protein n=1 Tax=Candidatus Scalindua rubra TaxID=1872076 RepID=A0A1E3XEB5_9BACT|nr:MAG: PEP-CTERM motif protein [Candidatus Scalindua rubra]